jgi:hypothetical protein
LWLQINSPQVLRSIDIRTLPYPGFPTDLQPQLMSLLTTCNGQSIVEETVFESRMRHGVHIRNLCNLILRTFCIPIFRFSFCEACMRSMKHESFSLWMTLVIYHCSPYNSFSNCFSIPNSKTPASGMHPNRYAKLVCNFRILPMGKQWLIRCFL